MIEENQWPVSLVSETVFSSQIRRNKNDTNVWHKILETFLEKNYSKCSVSGNNRKQITVLFTPIFEKLRNTLSQKPQDWKRNESLEKK